MPHPHARVTRLTLSRSRSHANRRWRGFPIGVFDAEIFFQCWWGATLVLLIATRNDWPVALLGVCAACVYFGVFVGVHLVL